MRNIGCKMRTLALLGLALQASVAWGQCSPIMIDLGKDGIRLGEAGVGVHFDVNDDGALDHVQWVRPGGDEGFLALDRNGNGLVDDGSELFGVGTPLIFDGGKAANGFIGLAQYDSTDLGGNDDGLITEADLIWDELRVWIDVDADGVSRSSEMHSLRSVGLTALGTIPRSRRQFDAAGNIMPYWTWAESGELPKRKALMVDVYFLVL